MAKIGRNDPCPCGSGKKYKQCHGPIDEARASEQRRLKQAHDTLFAKVMEAAPGFAGEFAPAIQAYWNDTFKVEAIDELDELEERGSERFLSWFMFDHSGPDGTTPLERLAAAPDELDLSPMEARLLPTWTSVRLQPYLVTEVVKGQGLIVRPLWQEQSMTLEDQAASRRVEQGEVLIVHLLPAGDVYLVGGAAAHLTADTASRLEEWTNLHLDDLRATQPDATYEDLIRTRSQIFNHFVMVLPREEQETTQIQTLIDNTRAMMAATAASILKRDVEEPARMLVPSTPEAAARDEDTSQPDSGA
jgi:hypothetical protein